MDHTGFYGTELRRSWSGPQGSAIIDEGDRWRLGLASACGGGDPDGRAEWLRSRFDGMIVDVIVSGV